MNAWKRLEMSAVLKFLSTLYVRAKWINNFIEITVTDVKINKSEIFKQFTIRRSHKFNFPVNATSANLWRFIMNIDQRNVAKF